MATSGLTTGLALPRPNFDTRVAEVGFVLVMFLIFVGLTPFDTRTAAAIAARDAASASGDALRQIAFSGTFALIAYSAFRQRGFAVVSAVPVMIAMLLVWCFMTALWSGEPDVVT